ncbi:MAG: co-chaperone GroES [Patescibacteria group bacterium]
MKIKPLADRLVIRPLEQERAAKGGIIIPETAKEKPQEGEVIAVGPGKLDKDGQRVPLEVKVGDKVLFSRYGGDEFKIDNIEYKILREDEVLGIVN